MIPNQAESFTGIDPNLTAGHTGSIAMPDFVIASSSGEFVRKWLSGRQIKGFSRTVADKQSIDVVSKVHWCDIHIVPFSG